MIFCSVCNTQSLMKVFACDNSICNIILFIILLIVLIWNICLQCSNIFADHAWFMFYNNKYISIFFYGTMLYEKKCKYVALLISLSYNFIILSRYLIILFFFSGLYGLGCCLSKFLCTLYILDLFRLWLLYLQYVYLGALYVYNIN